MIIVNDVYRRFGSIRALSGASLVVASGEITGLVGHNGAGKSTLVDVIAGLLRPDRGSIRVDNQDTLAHPAAAHSRIGLAPQQIGLYRRATVRQNLRFFAELKGLDSRASRSAIEEVADELQLSSFLDQPVVDLSGGQQRRTQTATAMFADPPVLIFDEPTVGADPETRSAILSAVRRRADRGAAIIYTTHYLPELVELEATLAVMKAGTVVARGSQSDLLAPIPHRLSIRFSGDLPEELSRSANVRADVASFTTMVPSDLLARILSFRVTVKGVDIQHPTLDDLYAGLAEDSSRAA